MQIRQFCFAASLATLAPAAAWAADADLTMGQDIFQAQCSACHSNQPGVNGIGPSLAGVPDEKRGRCKAFTTPRRFKAQA